MKTITFNATKGGTGKSTLSIIALLIAGELKTVFTKHKIKYRKGNK